MRTSRTLLGSVLVAALLAAAPLTAKAQRRPQQGTVRLSLDSEIFGVSVFPDSVNLIGLGFNGRGLGPGVGFAITNDILIGARTAFGFLTVDPNVPGDSTSGQISLLPYFEIVFGSEGLIPFVGAQAGFTAVFADGRDAYANFIGGAYGGLHAMLADSFSVSPFIELNFLYSGGSSLFVLGPDERGGFGVNIGVSLMGWIGDLGEAVDNTADEGFDTSGTEDGIFDRDGGGGDSGGGDGADSGGGDSGGGDSGGGDSGGGDVGDPEGGLE